jgi:hypothetical protein
MHFSNHQPLHSHHYKMLHVHAVAAVAAVAADVQHLQCQDTAVHVND